MRRLLPLALALCACAKPDLSSPFPAVVVTYDATTGAYRLGQVRINTLTSLRRLQGAAGQVRAGGTVRLLQQDVLDPAATVDSLRARAIREAPGEVDLAYSVLGGIVYPEDFQGLELLTAYFNLEDSRSLLSGWGLAALAAAPIVAHAAVVDQNGAAAAGDGELYLPALGSYYFPSASPTEQLPPVFNLGAVGHAIGHQIVQQSVWAGAPAAPPERSSAHDAPANTARHLARSFAEGVADYLGVAISQDQRWFEHSLQQTAAARDLDVVRCGTSNMLDALAVDDAQVPYDAYPLGTVLAGALWESSQAGVQISASGVLAALPAIGKVMQSGLSLTQVLDALAAAADDSRKKALCGLLLDRFRALGVGSLPSCAGGATAPVTVCP